MHRRQPPLFLRGIVRVPTGRRSNLRIPQRRKRPEASRPKRLPGRRAESLRPGPDLYMEWERLRLMAVTLRLARSRSLRLQVSGGPHRHSELASRRLRSATSMRLDSLTWRLQRSWLFWPGPQCRHHKRRALGSKVRPGTKGLESVWSSIHCSSDAASASVRNWRTWSGQVVAAN